MFLAEGLRILAEAEEAGRLPRYIFGTAEGLAHPIATRIADTAEARGGEVIETSRDILGKLSGKDNPQTVIGVYEEPATGLASIDRTTAGIWFVAQALRDPGNLGTMLRTGDAVGAGGLILIDDCVDPFSVEAVRASMGAIFTQRIARAAWDEFLPWLRAGPGQLIGTSLKTDLDYRAADYVKPTFLLIGNESHGLPEAYEQACDLRVKIPMRGKADSLNAAIAAAVVAYELLYKDGRA
jgi:TrmH family RNA methyltransferase